MKKIITGLVLLTVLALQGAMSTPLKAQQFSLPIWPEKVWPSEYANYNDDVHNCCDWLLNAATGFNEPKREECTHFLLRWLEGSPQVRVYIAEGLVDIKNSDLLVAYMAAWTRHALDNPDDNELLCANVAVNEMIAYYEANQKTLGKSKTVENLLKLRQRNELSSYVKKCLMGDEPKQTQARKQKQPRQSRRTKKQ